MLCVLWQAPTSAPTALPVALSVLSPWYPGDSRNATLLINPLADLRVYGGSVAAPPSTSPQFNWSTSNTSVLSPARLLASGPYLTIPAGSLTSGSTYVFRLRMTRSTGEGGSGQVRFEGHTERRQRCPYVTHLCGSMAILVISVVG